MNLCRGYSKYLRVFLTESFLALLGAIIEVGVVGLKGFECRSQGV